MSPRPPARAHPRRASLLGTALLVLAGLLAVLPAGRATTAEPRTWVVDAVDDALGSRWVAEDTGTTEVRISVGDTVEWQFDRAAIEHDLTSEDSATDWSVPVQEYRVPEGPPVRHTFTEPGTYAYLCSIHGTLMRGTVVVEAVGDDNRQPTAEPVVTPRTGVAPLGVHFEAAATDPDGDPLTYLWDFGTGDPGDRSTSAHAFHSYATPGLYTATLEISDGRGGVLARAFPITVSDGAPSLPDVEATADIAVGTAPLDVGFSTVVTTAGEVKAFSDGLTSHPDLTGTATMVRSRDRTVTTLRVAGLTPGAAHMVHVHEQACSSANGGAHFRFDESQPFAEENEIWLPFTSDEHGASGAVTVTSPLRAGSRAVSVVIHDPDNPARRIGCTDLLPRTDGLTYTWDFGDGATGGGPDPDHSYARPGSYTATVAVGHQPPVADGRHGHDVAPAASDVATASVRVLVTAPPDVTAPRTSITGGPTGTVRSGTARFRLASSEAGSRFACRLDGRARTPCAARTIVGGLRDGPHRLRVRATDAAGNTDPTPAVRRWTVDSRGPVVRKVRPSGTTRDRTPRVRASVTDRWSVVRRRNLVLRIDGRRVANVRYDRRRGSLTWTPRKALRPGRHTVRVVAVDGVGNRTVRGWRFRVLR